MSEWISNKMKELFIKNIELGKVYYIPISWITVNSYNPPYRANQALTILNDKLELIGGYNNYFFLADMGAKFVQVFIYE